MKCLISTFTLLFWYKGQIGRKTYLLSNATLYILCSVALYTDITYRSIPEPIMVIAINLLFYISVCLHIKRLRDAGFRLSDFGSISGIRGIRRAIYFLPFCILFTCCFKARINHQSKEDREPFSRTKLPQELRNMSHKEFIRFLFSQSLSNKE